MSKEEFDKACENGNFDLVKKMALNNTYDWNWSLESAAVGGHLHIIQFLIEKGANNLYWGLHDAAIGGHIHIIQFFIEKGVYYILSEKTLKEYKQYLFNKEYIRSIDYNRDLLEEIVAYY